VILGIQPDARGVPWSVIRWPTPATVAATGDAELTRRLFGAWGREGAALGFRFLLGPSCALARTDAAFGVDPGDVTRHVTAAVTGLQEGGLEAFPLLFPANVEPSAPLPRLEKEGPGLEAEDLAPIRAALPDIGAVGVGHTVCPAWDEEHPASASRRVLRLLRARLPFAGVWVGGEIAVLPDPLAHLAWASTAGADLHLCTAEPAFIAEIYESLIHMQEEDAAVDRAFEDSDLRLEALLARPTPAEVPPFSAIGDPEHRILAAWIRQRGS